MGQSSRALLVLLAAAFLASCSGADSTAGAVGTGGQADSPIVIGSSPKGLVIENRGRSPLTDIKISIKASGNTPTFERSVPVLAPSERKEMALTDFKSSTNVTLQPMFVTPKEVTVTAKDETGKDVRVTMPWK